MKGRPPPLRHCRECGTHMRAFQEAPLCNPCAKKVRDSPPLNIRETLRKRKQAEQSSRPVSRSGLERDQSGRMEPTEKQAANDSQ